MKRGRSDGFSYLISYTMGKSLDHCSGYFNEDGCNPQDPCKFNDN